MGKLYIVPTPIGNLEDITLRALRILKESDAILAEDTRVSAKLLSHYEIKKPLLAHHQHNEHKTVDWIASRIQAGETIALISDAGTPGISDPGFLLVRECIKQGIEVDCLPGPTAFVPALVQSGLPCDQFIFLGFMPQKKGRQTRFKNLANEARTMVFYESPYRLVKFLEEAGEHWGKERRVCVSRELTKMFEENFRGTAAEAHQHFTSKTVKGEIVIIVQGRTEQEDESESE
jgi:16S rRNA (cytidine1402-2'-O)-methyltransferase